MPTDYEIEPLVATHDRAAFSCGIASLDGYMQRQAMQDMKRDLAAVYVLTDSETHTHIVGYYTLSATSLEAESLPVEITRRLPRYPLLPATLIGRLAVDNRYKGRKYGQRLLLDAFRRSIAAAKNIATLAIVVDATDDDAARFYRRFGFQPLTDHPLRLFIPMGTARVAVSDA